MNATAGGSTPELTDSTYSWWRLAVSVLLSTIGGVGMWSVVVVLPAMQAGVVTHARAVVFHAKPAVALQPQLDCPVRLSET